MNEKDTGKRLREARQGLGLSIQEAARQTRIRDFFLQALEAGDWDELPSQAQVKGFVRNYAAFLNLQLDQEQPPAPEVPTEESPAPEADSPRKQAAQEPPAPQPEPPQSRPPDSRYLEIGRDLKARRTGLGLSLQELAGQTRIKARYLAWIEAGDFEAFPSPTQARGMLTTYAAFLGMEREALDKFGAALLDEYRLETAVQESMPPREVAGSQRRRQTIRIPRWVRRYLSFDVLGLVALTALLLGVFLWGLGQVASLREAAEIPPTAPPLAAELLLPSPSPAIAASPTALADEPGPANEAGAAQPTEVPQITIEVANPGGVELVLIAGQREWVRVTVDDTVVFEGRTAPGDRYTYSGDDRVLVYTGNAAAFRAFLNDSDLGPLGIEGEVIELLFTRAGAATPSPSPTPTPDPLLVTATAEAAALDEPTQQP